jgi:uncharacterized protein YjiK
MKTIAGILLLTVMLSGCANQQDRYIPFDFNHPLEFIKLPQSLHEISGIAFYRKRELACVQDEKGIIFFYDIKKDKLRNNIKFAKNKDYEGIANVNDTLFVLSSNGEIAEIDSNSENGYANTYNTFLSKNNNCEGLCFDKKNNRLLVACKGKPEKHTASHGMKAVYAFDLASKTLIKQPVYIIDPDSVKRHLVETEQRNFIQRLFGKNSSEKEFLFEPSEISIDPFNNDVYILSSVGKTILQLDEDGTIISAYHLDPEIYKQPEGLTFSADGNMFISDEGREGKANLIRIKREAR